MSTILNALKQAEKNSPDQQFEGSYSFNNRSALSSKMNRQTKKLFLGPWISVITILLVIATVVFFIDAIFLNKNTTALKMAANESPSLSLDASSKPVAVISKPKVFAATKPIATPQIRRTPTPISSIPNETIVENVSDSELMEYTRSELDEPIELTQKESVTKALNQNNEINNKAKPSIDEVVPLTGDALNIQALAWAQEPGNRIAVINDVVLEEGRSVQGYQLIVIEKNSVVLQKAGKSYRLTFRRQ